MREKIFDSLPDARLFCEKLRADGYECDVRTDAVRRRRVKTFTQTISYLRRSPNRSRRVRVTYVRTWKEVRIVTVKIHRVRYFKPDLWQHLPTVLRRIQEKYRIKNKNVSYPKNFLKWFHTPTGFFSWSRSYPPYKGIAHFVKVEMWAVLTRNDNAKEEEEYFIYSWSRARGLEGGIDWESILKVKAELEADVAQMIENKADYMELHEWIGFAAYPEANWYFKTVKSKAGDAHYYPRRKMPGS